MIPSIISGFILLPLAVLAVSNEASGKLSSLDGGLGGTVSVINETALQIDDYTLKEASAPALYWWGSKTDELSSGFRINNERVSKPASTDTIVIPLDAGKTTNDFSVVGLWCEKLHANFGQATLEEDVAPATSSESPQNDAGVSSVSKSAAVLSLLGAVAFAAQLI